jgi:hypothetical protein
VTNESWKHLSARKTDRMNTKLLFLINQGCFLKSIVTPIESIVTDNRPGAMGGIGKMIL